MDTQPNSEPSDSATGIPTLSHDPKWLLHSLLTTAQDCIYFKDRESRFIVISPAHARMFGLDDPSQAVGKTDFDFFDEKHARKAFDDEQRIITTGEPLRSVEEMETWPDGSVTWCSTTKVAVRDDSGAIVGIVGISRDITEKKLHEKHLQQVNRLYAAMSQVNQSILQARTRVGLFSEVCRALVEYAKNDMAWIGTVSPGDSQVEVAGRYGDVHHFLRRNEFFHDGRPLGRGPVGRAIREGTTQVVNNVNVDSEMAPWLPSLQQNGWISCAAVPIKSDSQAIGVLVVYSKAIGYFSEKEVILLERAASDIASALKMIDALAAIPKSSPI